MRILSVILFLLFGAVSSEAAIAVTNLASSADTSNVTSYTSGSFVPTANALIVAIWDASRTSASPDVPTVTGGSLTWNNIHDFIWSPGTRRFNIWAAQASGSPSSMTVNATYANALTGTRWTIFEVTGSDVSNGVSQCFVQAVDTTPNASGTSMSITLAAAGNANNRSFLFATHVANEAYTVDTANNWAQIGFGGHSNPTIASDSQWRTDAFDTSVTTSWATSITYGGVAFEIKAGAVGGTALFRNRYGSRARFMQ